MKRKAQRLPAWLILPVALLAAIGFTPPAQAQDADFTALLEPLLSATSTNTPRISVLNFRELEHVAPNGTFYASNPAWLLGAAQFGGEWTTKGWQVPAATPTNIGSLVIDLDRTSLTKDLSLTLGVTGQAGAKLYIDLLNTNDAPVATDLFGNILSGNTASNVELSIPLGDYPDAVVINLRRGIGAVTVAYAVLVPDGSNTAASATSSRAAWAQVLSGLTLPENNSFAFTPATADTVTPSQDVQSSPSAPSITNSTWYVSSMRGRNTYSGRRLWWNGQQHGPFATINRALGAAVSNDTVVIVEGRYPENVNLRGKNVRVIVNGNIDLRGKN